MSAPLTAVKIPCCLCGSMIEPNAANQCGACLAQSINLKDHFEGPYYTYQCRTCRRFQNTKHYEPMEPESPELMSVCLRQLPLDPFKVVDASWIWTEPHSQRWKLKLTLRKEIESVQVQQRVMVELRNKWLMCDDCNRQYSNRTWQAVVQVRQHTRNKKTLASLEMAISKNSNIRKHVLSIDSVNDGFDFYFLSNVHANTFVHHLQGVAPMRVKTSTKMVSEDLRNNTANVKTTHTIDIVPVGRDDLLFLPKSVKSKLGGRIVLVSGISSNIRLIDGNPQRTSINDAISELSPEQYYKNEKGILLLSTPARLTRYVVLDVEVCDNKDSNDAQYRGPQSGVSKFSLADIQVAKENDFDEVYHVVSHLGHLVQAGDTVLGYDLNQLTFDIPGEIPDIVLVKKLKVDESVIHEPDGRPKISKKRERRNRKENRRARELEESAERMGFLQEDPDFDMDLEALEEELEALGVDK